MADSEIFNTHISCDKILSQEKYISPFCLLQINQEAGAELFAKQGLTRERLLEQNCVTVFSEIFITVTGASAKGELALSTWFSDTRGVRAIRQLSLTDRSGNKIAGVRTHSVYMDFTTRRVVRPEGLKGAKPAVVYGLEPACEEVAFPRFCKNAMPVGEITVTDEHTDFNRHVNNARYARFVMRFLTPEQIKSIGFFAIKYSCEAVKDDIIKIFRFDRENEMHFYGDMSAGRSFEAIVRMRIKK